MIIQVFGVCKENDVIGFPLEDASNGENQVTHFTVAKLFSTISYMCIGCITIYREISRVQK